MKKSYLLLLFLFPLGFFTAYYAFPRVIEKLVYINSNFGVYLTSFEDNQIVHSKIVIDASFDGNIKSVSVKINGKEMANYVPYLWNNILAPAGEYLIEVEVTDELGAKTSTSKTVIIPKFESYNPENFTCTEDIVIHKGQTVRWENGTFNCSIPHVDNGVNMEYSEPVFINIYGNLILKNVTVLPSKDISVEHTGYLKLENSATPEMGGAYLIWLFEKSGFECIHSNFGGLYIESDECIVNIDAFSEGYISMH